MKYRLTGVEVAATDRTVEIPDGVIPLEIKNYVRIKDGLNDGQLIPLESGKGSLQVPAGTPYDFVTRITCLEPVN